MTRRAVPFSFRLPLEALALVAALGAPARAQACFESDSPLDARRGAVGVRCVDLDLDGHDDLITSDWATHGGSLSVAYGRGQGSFSAPTLYRLGEASEVIECADLNGDGYPDLVAHGGNRGDLSVFLNQGDGTLAPRVDYDPGVGLADCVACADFDGDGDLDLAVGSNDSSWLKLFLNNGYGGFSTTPSFYQAPVIEIVAADLDGDGDPDLAALSSPEVIQVFINQGSGSFASPVQYEVPVWDAYHLAGADFDGDGDQDLAVLGTHDHATEIVVFANSGTATFGTPTSYAFGSTQDCRVLTVADLDGDTHPEIIATGRQVIVLGNQGNGTFITLEAQATAAYPNAVDAADLDGDGRKELLVASYNQLWVMHNEGGWRFSAPPRIPLDKPQVQVISADVDRDGALDLVEIERSMFGDALGRVRILHNAGGGDFRPTASYLVGRCPAAITASDLDGDGALDLVVANDGYYFIGPTGSVSVLLNHGDGTFAREVRTTLGTYPLAITCADVDRDGDADVLLLEVGPFPSLRGKLAVLLNDGHGGLGVPTRFDVGMYPSELQVADLDGDGALDVAALNLGQPWHHNDVSLLRNLGNGTFASALTVAAGLGPRSLACGDVDQDGDADLVLGGSNVNVLLNSGTGVFGAPQVHPLAFASGPIVLRDVDGDGAPDLLALNGSLNTVSVLTNSGGGGFTKAGEYAAGSNLGSMCVDDLDGDGDAEVACTGLGGITLLYNCTSHGTAFCFGDGTAGACPCNNPGASGHGCDNSASTGGARLSSQGLASLAHDALSLTCTGGLPASVSVVMQGTLRYSPVSFGDGLRCVSGALKRLYIGPAIGGVLVVPQPGDPSISARSAAMGDSIQAGSTRLYQVYYRDPDPGFCPAPQGNSWNISSGLSVHWVQ